MPDALDGESYDTVPLSWSRGLGGMAYNLIALDRNLTPHSKGGRAVFENEPRAQMASGLYICMDIPVSSYLAHQVYPYFYV